MNWNDLRYFLTIARTESLTATARDMHVSQSTVSRRIAALEESLGTRLFIRHSTGYFLTDQGRDVLRRVEAVEEGITALKKNAAGLDTQASGLVRLALPESLAIHLVIPALPSLTQRHPGLRLEMITGINMVDLPRNEVDLAVRLVRPQHGNLTIQKLGTMHYAIYGSTDYLQRCPSPDSDPVAGRSFIVWDQAYAHLPTALWLSQRAYDTHPALVTTSVAAQYAAVRAGIGLALLPCFIPSSNDALVQIIPPEDVFSETLWLLVHADLRASARIRVVAEFLQETFAQQTSSLFGTLPA